MATNKNASIRYRALDKCFRDYRHRYFIKEPFINPQSVSQYRSSSTGYGSQRMDSMYSSNSKLSSTPHFTSACRITFCSSDERTTLPLLRMKY